MPGMNRGKKTIKKMKPKKSVKKMTKGGKAKKRG
jgi:hypothetical protein